MRKRMHHATHRAFSQPSQSRNSGTNRAALGGRFR